MYRRQPEVVKGAAQQSRLTLKPNPVEPDSTFKRVVAQPASVFQYATTSQLRGVLQQDVTTPTIVDGGAVKRRKLDDSGTYDLPRLPIRATQERRPRLPPTLSGLYQPPPDAGLLPSISVDKPEQPADAPAAVSRPVVAEPTTIVEESGKRKPGRGRAGRNRWSEDETRHLIQGVSRFGIGNWTKVLQCPDYLFHNRSALDLKDRFRVCFPEQYGGAVITPRMTATASRVKVKDSLDLGTRTHFPRSTRRQRHGFSEAEDEHLLQGFQKYGKSWSSIQQDPLLMLQHRTRTDLRDRMRNKFPDLLLKPAEPEEIEESTAQPAEAPSNTKIADLLHTPPRAARPPTLISPPQYGSNWRFDPDMSFIFDDTDYDQAVTLDRGILDWPLHSGNVVGNIDVQTSVPTMVPATSLPSLATVRANDSNIDDLLIHELPALAQFLTPPLEIDGRSSAHAFLSLDELLS